MPSSQKAGPTQDQAGGQSAACLRGLWRGCHFFSKQMEKPLPRLQPHLFWIIVPAVGRPLIAASETDLKRL